MDRNQVVLPESGCPSASFNILPDSKIVEGTDEPPVYLELLFLPPPLEGARGPVERGLIT